MPLELAGVRVAEDDKQNYVLYNTLLLKGIWVALTTFSNAF